MATTKNIDALNQLLADLTVDYHKLQNAHWYITGKDFFQVHATLEELYDQKRGASPFLQAWGQAAHRRQAIAICKWYNARMECKSNNNVVYSCKYHVVFCPKYRRSVLVDGVDERFRQIARQVADELHFEIIEMEVMPDHVHMLLEVDPQLGIHRAVKRIKGRTSHDLRAEFPWLKSRIPTLWTNSYFVSTVGGAPLAIVRQYIENQKNV